MGKKTLTRLIFAAGISLTCFAATYIWYHSSGLDQQRGSGQKPIAYAEKTKDEIHRRPVTRLIWQLVNDGEPLFPGEAIRTSQNGEVRIQFAESEKYIDLEPDSLIIISQSKNEISLDLMDGSFMVAQNAAGNEGSGGPSLTLKSANGKVDLSQATASLSKSNSGNIDLQVLKGKATLESNGQSKDIESGKSGALGAKGGSFNQDSLKILSPSIDKVTYVNPDALEPVSFRWSGFPPGSIVTLVSGINPKNLKPQGDTTTSNISLKLPVGKHYWKLLAKDKAGSSLGESTLYRLEMNPRFAPAAVFPEPNAQVVKVSTSEGLTFKWTQSEMMSSVLIEVSKDPLFKAPLAYSKRFTNENSASVNLPISDYYWRLSAAYPDSDRQITSKVQKFYLGPPHPKVTINWQNAESTVPQYFVDQPMVSLGWLSEQKDQVKNWRLRLAENESDLQSSQAHVVDTKDLTAKTKIAKPGRFIAMVEALDINNRVIASSPMKSIEVAPLPLLPGPKFNPDTGELKADNQGKLDLKWNSVAGAKEYQLTLLNPQGKELKSAKFSKNSTALVNLLPGQYQVQIIAIDQHGRLGEKESPRAVLVPEGSGLTAPKLKKMKVN